MTILPILRLNATVSEKVSILAIMILGVVISTQVFAASDTPAKPIVEKLFSKTIPSDNGKKSFPYFDPKTGEIEVSEVDLNTAKKGKTNAIMKKLQLDQTKWNGNIASESPLIIIVSQYEQKTNQYGTEYKNFFGQSYVYLLDESFDVKQKHILEHDLFYHGESTHYEHYYTQNLGNVNQKSLTLLIYDDHPKDKTMYEKLYIEWISFPDFKNEKRQIDCFYDSKLRSPLCNAFMESGYIAMVPDQNKLLYVTGMRSSMDDKGKDGIFLYDFATMKNERILSFDTEEFRWGNVYNSVIVDNDNQYVLFLLSESKISGFFERYETHNGITLFVFDVAAKKIVYKERIAGDRGDISNRFVALPDNSFGITLDNSFTKYKIH